MTASIHTKTLREFKKFLNQHLAYCEKNAWANSAGLGLTKMFINKLKEIEDAHKQGKKKTIPV